MADKNRDDMVKPDFMTEEEFEWFKEKTASVDLIVRDANADVEAYLANPEGWSTGEVSGFPTLLLTVTGRKSGKKRTTPLVFMKHNDSYVVVGSLAGYDRHPAWYVNIKADPNCEVQLDHDKMQATGRDVTEEEREALWPKLVEVFPPWGYFQSQTDRPFSIVILSPTGSA
jgi:deazaflavin-dependent oxidoreductase (nitroreductase family)